MFQRVFNLSSSRTLATIVVVLLAGCADRPLASSANGVHIAAVFPVSNPDANAIQSLRKQLIVLSPTIHPDEAQRVAECAYASADQLAREYRVVGPPLFHNFLVNTGIRKRGLCFQWAEDLFAQLDRLKVSTLELHWGEARARTLREHNCVVVTAKGQPFHDGIVLDCWRHGGHLFTSSVTGDHYPWIEDADYLRTARARAAAARPQPGSDPRNAVVTSTTHAAAL
ncbi:MAG: hypothetical protein QOH24_653 [Verrucomicrobiota bacterium]